MVSTRLKRYGSQTDTRKSTSGPPKKRKVATSSEKIKTEDTHCSNASSDEAHEDGNANVTSEPSPTFSADEKLQIPAVEQADSKDQDNKSQTEENETEEKQDEYMQPETGKGDGKLETEASFANDVVTAVEETVTVAPRLGELGLQGNKEEKPADKCDEEYMTDTPCSNVNVITAEGSSEPGKVKQHSTAFACVRNTSVCKKQDGTQTECLNGLSRVADDTSTSQPLEVELEETGHIPVVDDEDSGASEDSDVTCLTIMPNRNEAGNKLRGKKSGARSVDSPVPPPADDPAADVETVPGEEKTAAVETVPGEEKTAPVETVHGEEKTAAVETVPGEEKTAAVETVPGEEKTAAVETVPREEKTAAVETVPGQKTADVTSLSEFDGNRPAVITPVTSQEQEKCPKKKKKKKKNKNQPVMLTVLSGADIMRQIPRGITKSRRVWKEPSTKFSSTFNSKGLKQSFEQKQQLRQELQRIKEHSRALKAMRLKEKEENKKRIAEARKIREENIKRAEVVQVITNTAKLKRMTKKQMRSIVKRDTTKVCAI